ncbi:MAG: MotA/TolQ/ExbB proton channel family protein [Steroidobacteraceae bacterium]
MNLLGLLENGLFALGQVLRFPVMALLWVCVGFALYYAGHALIEAVTRLREHAGFNLKQWLQQGVVLSADESHQQVLPRSLRLLLSDVQHQQQSGTLKHGGLENLVAEHEERLRHALNGPRALVKIGPSLGLLGTLIPMGSSLAAMASGNLQAMAGQMVVAFTTTIIGLATGTVAYAVVAARQSWVNAAIREQRYLAEVVVAELEQR